MPNSIFKKQLSPIKPGDPIDYKDVELLKKFITERGKILPRRMTGLTSTQQRDLMVSQDILLKRIGEIQLRD